jgi:hypothetical protein
VAWPDATGRIRAVRAVSDVGLLNCCSVTIGPMGRVPIVVSQSVHVRYCWSRLLWRKFRSVFFLPDRILVLQGSMNADVDWSQVTTVFAQRRFIEGEGVAGDAEVVGQTLKYLKKGGPDQRFKDNRQLPICFYGEATLNSPNGFRAEWQSSNRKAAGSGSRRWRQ